MENLSLRRTVICLALLNLSLWTAGCPRKRVGVESPRVPPAKVETRKYTAGNGYDLAITSLGSIVGLRGPKEAGADSAPVRDGYKLTYRNPRDGRQIVASTPDGADKGGASAAGNFVPVSFESPTPGAVSGDESLTAKVTVRTDDGLLLLTHLLTWKPASDSVTVQTTIANTDARRAVPVISFERTFDVTGDAAATEKMNASKAFYSKFLTYDPQQGRNGLMLTIRCGAGVDCPLPPPIRPHRLTGDRSPVAVITQTAADPSGGRSDGAKRGSLMWEFKSSLSAQTPLVFTTQFSRLDAVTP